MKAEVTSDLPVDPNWTYEIKFDGYRALLVRNEKDPQIFSRNQKSFEERFAEIKDKAKSILCKNYCIDGEIVALDKKGMQSFQALQNYQENSEHSLQFYAFDILNLNGFQLTRLSLERRRELLKQVLSNSEIPISESFDVPPKILMENAKKIGLEGLIAKKLDSLYAPGERVTDWLKYKFINEQEFVIGGYSLKSNRYFNSLLVGFYEKGKLKYAGKVNGGYTPSMRKELFPKLRALRQTKCAFNDLPEKSHGRWNNGITKAEMSEYVWLKPKLVCVVRFREWTDNLHLRHAAFIALRDDKSPLEVRRHA